LLVGIIIASIIGAITLLLCIPVYGLIDLRVEETPRLSLTWLFGAYKRQFPGDRSSVGRGKQRSVQRIGWSRGLQGLLTGELKGNLAKLMHSVVRRVRIENLEVDFRLGLDDPADTALLLGPAGAASVLLNLYTAYDIRVIPILEGETCQGYLKAKFRWLPIQSFQSLAAFLFSKTGRQMVELLVSRR
jgi:hypothetical protein